MEAHEKKTRSEDMNSAHEIITEPVPRIALRLEEAAHAIGVCRRTLDTWSTQPGFPVVRIGKCVLVPVDALRDWLARQIPAAEA